MGPPSPRGPGAVVVRVAEATTCAVFVTESWESLPGSPTERQGLAWAVRPPGCQGLQTPPHLLHRPPHTSFIVLPTLLHRPPHTSFIVLPTPGRSHRPTWRPPSSSAPILLSLGLPHSSVLVLAPPAASAALPHSGASLAPVPAPTPGC
ncbi:hypothetical protein P7K49_005887 [Saguinus oedipus]|uniref:Uncharacterized protein n=1 Tax=Saguinus oedipus TaxID=9490 RepID=A0ABQ9W0T9_SAGOE|nr:hypothetical protein P7K49_005887 [Saguinus oedipus]